MKLVLFLILVLVDLAVTVTLVFQLFRYAVTALRKHDPGHLRVLLRKIAIAFSAAIAVSIIFIVSTQLIAHSPKIVDENGNKIESSISELLQIEVNGHQEWLSIRSKDTQKPILLFLSGGPGGTQLAATRFELSALEDEFIVVNWEQPGAGKSYNCMNRSDITVDTYIEDCRVVTEYLCDRFGQDQIFLLGESWGSALEIFLAEKYPELYAGFIGTGQMVDFEETELIDYTMAIKIAQENGDTNTVKKLQQQGAPLYYSGNIALKAASYLNVLTNRMTSNPDITNGGYHTLRDMFAAEYGIMDSIHFLLGIVNTFNVVYPQLYEVDLREKYQTIKVPVYFFLGRQDINAPTELAQEYFKLLQCPQKELVWFEHSGHNPWMNELERFVSELVRVLGLQTDQTTIICP